MLRDKKKKYTDSETANRLKDKLIPEEFPEGAYGSAINKHEAPESKSTPWTDGQYRDSAYVYPDRAQHAETPRQADGAHPTHSEEEEAEN